MGPCGVLLEQFYSFVFITGKIFGIEANYLVAEVEFREGEEGEEEGAEVIEVKSLSYFILQCVMLVYFLT